MLIASPRDLPEERVAAGRAIERWNATYGAPRGVILEAVRWELATVLGAGARTQDVVNHQIVDDADILVAMFWTVVGTPTGGYESGTHEEVRAFIDSGRPLLLYFSNGPVAPDLIDLEQLRKVKDLRANLARHVLYGEFDGPINLEGLLIQHLGAVVDRLDHGALNDEPPSTVVVPVESEPVLALESAAPPEEGLIRSAQAYVDAQRDRFGSARCSGTQGPARSFGPSDTTAQGDTGAGSPSACEDRLGATSR